MNESDSMIARARQDMEEELRDREESHLLVLWNQWGDSDIPRPTPRQLEKFEGGTILHWRI